MNLADLLLLACPAMMVLCVFGMRGRSGDATTPKTRDDSLGGRKADSTLEERLADLLVENDDLRRRLEAREGASRPVHAPESDLGRAAP